MAEGQQPKRRLKLSRETLRSLEPSAQEAEGVRGGQIPSVGGEGDTCHSICNCTLTGDVWGRAPTHMSWGCVGQVKVWQDDRGAMVYDFDLHPNEELVNYLDRIAPDTSKPLRSVSKTTATRKTTASRKPATRKTSTRKSK